MQQQLVHFEYYNPGLLITIRNDVAEFQDVDFGIDEDILPFPTSKTIGKQVQDEIAALIEQLQLRSMQQENVPYSDSNAFVRGKYSDGTEFCLYLINQRIEEHVQPLLAFVQNLQ